MKIIILSEIYPRKNFPIYGIFIHQQIKALQQLGAECHVLQQYYWYPPFGMHKLHHHWLDGHNTKQTLFGSFENVMIHHVPVFIKMPGRFFKENTYDRSANAIVKYVKRHKELSDANWLYAHFLTPMGYIGALVKDRLNMKLAVIGRGDDIHAWPEKDPSLRTHFPLVFEKADLVMTNSGNLGHDARKWMEPGNIRAVETVYNGVDHEKFRPISSDDEKHGIRQKYKLSDNIKYIVCIATRVELKGWNELLQAVRRIGAAFDGWKLLMVAPPRSLPDALGLDKIARGLGIEDRVQETGALSSQQIAELLRASDAFILPSYNEGMANALLEAMASGLPCISTNVGGHNEVIKNGEDGILIAPRSIAAIEEALKTLLPDDALQKSMGERARLRMLTYGSYDENAKVLLQLFNSH